MCEEKLWEGRRTGPFPGKSGTPFLLARSLMHGTPQFINAGAAMISHGGLECRHPGFHASEPDPDSERAAAGPSPPLRKLGWPPGSLPLAHTSPPAGSGKGKQRPSLQNGAEHVTRARARWEVPRGTSGHGPYGTHCGLAIQSHTRRWPFAHRHIPQTKEQSPAAPQKCGNVPLTGPTTSQLR